MTLAHVKMVIVGARENMVHILIIVTLNQHVRMREHVSAVLVIVSAPMVVKPPIIVIPDQPVQMREHVSMADVTLVAHIQTVQNRPV